MGFLLPCALLYYYCAALPSHCLSSRSFSDVKHTTPRSFCATVAAATAARHELLCLVHPMHTSL